jgi:5-methyltetrahydrofolate--homocysteine methyltransferase
MRTILLDGAQGTRLQKFGLPYNTPSPRWNLENPEKVTEMHRLYAHAGAQILLTNTFGACDAAEFESALECIKEFSGACRIAGSIGPHTDLKHAGILSSLVDFYVLETFSDLETAKQALMVLEKLGKPVVVSFAWLFEENDFYLRSGTSVDNFVNEISGWPLHAVGANCSVGSKNMTKLALKLLDKIKQDVWIKSNAGQPRWVDDHAFYDQTPEEFVRDLSPLIGLVRYLGGCCGTDEHFIKALRQRCV